MIKNGFKDTFLNKLSNFSESDRELFDRIYWVCENKGALVPPKEMISWIESNFGSVENVTSQDFLRITDTITYEGAIFNELRTMRPVVGDKDFGSVLEAIENARTGPFSHPQTGTPEDTFGRIEGKYCITASNIAKYDGLHGLIINNTHDPLLFSRKRVRDYIDVLKKWINKAHQTNKEAIYPFYTWSCLWKSGASIIHGHSQVVLATGQAYTKIEQLRYLSLKYQEKYRSNYFDDVFAIHDKLGLSFEKDGARFMVKITPIKEKEIMILANDINTNLADLISDSLTTLKEELGVASFNLSLIFKPLLKTPEVWDHMPIIVRIVDRGKLTEKTADVGPMELYGQSIIESNPYVVHEKLRKSITNSPAS